MGRILFKPWTLASALGLLLCCAACSRKLQPDWKEKLNQKMVPTDFFADQRAWPDSSFDSRGWQQVVARTIMEERAAKPNSCSGNSSSWTSQGPGNVGGRCTTIAVKPGDDMTVLAGFAGGGIFKTTDGGLNWHAVFDEHPMLSIGHIAYDPSNPEVVYAGTGDPDMPSIVFNGNGLYKSTDGGESWQQTGLVAQGIISKVWVHPQDPQTILCATMGNPYIRTNERGVYKSTDGGLNWQRVLFVSNQAGASDLVASPAAPNVLFACFWDRLRSNQESILYGPHATVWKSTDTGATWTQLTNGLPGGIMGRTGLAISQTDPNKVYVVYIDSLSTPGGLYKTTDGGQSWSSMNIGALEDATGNFGWFFGRIKLNPTNDEEVYFLAILQWRKAAGSTGWQVVGNGHADSHDLVITPSGRRYWGNDGGVYYVEPNQLQYKRSKNLPTTQFYRTTYNPHLPDVYWGGTQDNGIQKGNAAGFNNWSLVFSADGFHSAFVPDNPQRFWVEIQNGQVHNTNDGGQSWNFGQPAFGTGDRCSWDAAFFRSDLTGSFYAATYRALSSADGSGWGAISQDLTDGVIYGDRFHLISCMSESPIVANKLYVGTSDANVWRSQAGVWTNITGNLPNRYVTAVVGSPTLSNRIFVTHSGFRYNEKIPHVHRSDDNGASWTDISGNLPQLPVNDIFIPKNHADSILIIANDAGVYYTRNGGVYWDRLGDNMPYVPVFDLIENPVRKELVAASFARGIWTFPLDSILTQQSSTLVSLSGQVRNDLGQTVALVDVLGEKTGITGQFNVSNLPGCNTYTLKPQRNDGYLNGVSTLDLVQISKHILGVEALNTPYRMIAADANQSGSITTFDIVELRKLILGIYDTLPKSKSWRFVPSDFVFPNPVNPFQTAFPEEKTVHVQQQGQANLHFTAIKVGDVNTSAIPALSDDAAEERKLETWPVVAEYNFEPVANRLQVQFSTGTKYLAGLQFSLQFDPETLIFDRLEILHPVLRSEHFNLNRTADGQLSIAVEAVDGLEEMALFTLHFRIQNEYGGAKLAMSHYPTPCRAFDAAGKAYLPVITPGKVVEDKLFPSVSPNPFGKEGCWIAMNQGEGDFTLQLYDPKGNLIREQVFKALSGGSKIALPGDWFPHSGIYGYKISRNGKNQEVYSGKLLFGF